MPIKTFFCLLFFLSIIGSSNFCTAQVSPVFKKDWVYYYRVVNGSPNRNLKVVFIDSTARTADFTINHIRKSNDFTLIPTNCMPLIPNSIGVSEIITSEKRGILTGKFDTIWLPTSSKDTALKESYLQSENKWVHIRVKSALVENRFNEQDTSILLNLLLLNSLGDTIYNSRSVNDTLLKYSEKYGLINSPQWLNFPESLQKEIIHLIGLQKKNAEEWKGTVYHPNGTDFDLEEGDEWHTVRIDFGQTGSFRYETKHYVTKATDSGAVRNYLITHVETLFAKISTQQGSRVDTQYTLQKVYETKFTVDYSPLTPKEEPVFLYRDAFGLELDAFKPQGDVLGITALRVDDRFEIFDEDSLCWKNRFHSTEINWAFQLYPLGLFFYRSPNAHKLPVYYKKSNKHFGTPLSTQEIKETEDIAIFPNPATRNLIISNYFPFTYEMYDAMGNKIAESKVPSTREWVDLEKLPANFYFIKLFTPTASIVKKVIVY